MGLETERHADRLRKKKIRPKRDTEIDTEERDSSLRESTEGKKMKSSSKT